MGGKVHVETGPSFFSRSWTLDDLYEFLSLIVSIDELILLQY